MPAAQGDNENCVAHNGSLIPVPGRDLKVQAWYQGGISIMDFTEPEKPVEIAYFDRGPVDEKMLVVGGPWSTYWYNGYIYSSEIARGLDILELIPSEFLSQNEIDAAKSVRVAEFNAQNQQRIVWPRTQVVAKAYLDQLERSQGLPAEKIKALRQAIGANQKARLKKMAQELREGLPAVRNGLDARRIEALAAIL